MNDRANGVGASNCVWRGIAGLVIVVGLLIPLCLTEPSSLVAQSCPWPSDSDIALAFCDAAHNNVAGEYPALYDVSIDVSVPPVILKAMGWYETWDSPGGWGWRQCLGAAPYGSSDGCAWGIMQVWTGMDCDHVTPFGEATRQAVKSDYRYNIAMGTHILVNKWHERQTHQQVGNGSPDIAEHWYFATWAYNSWEGPGAEYHGWNNNPNNPSFTRQGYTQNPGSYPYQEVVWWLAANPRSRPGGSPLWRAVPLTLPPNSAFPDQAQMHMEPWSISDPLPTHWDYYCRECYLPLVLKNYHTDTYEPNGSCAQAWPIDVGPTYDSYIWDPSDNDYYQFTPDHSGAVNIDLWNIPAGCDYDLYLYNSACQWIAQSDNGGNAPEHLRVEVSPPGGPYYVRVMSFSGYNRELPYRLQVSWSSKATAPYPPP